MDNLQLTVCAGQCICVCGDTGVGKSTLLKLIANQYHAPYSGERIVHGNGLIALVMQDPSRQFLRREIGAEVAFALENLGYRSQEMPALVRRALDRVGLSYPLDWPIAQLSLGQQYRLLVAAQIVYQPDILLLDEPFAQLDDAGVSALITVLQELAHGGVTLVISEHHPTAFMGLCDAVYHLHQGQLQPWQPPRARALTSSPSTAMATPPAKLAPEPATDALITTSGFELSYPRKPPLLKVPALTVTAGQLVIIYGDNGGGKSSLLKAFSGMVALTDSDVLVLGRAPEIGCYQQQLGLLLQRPARQLFALTVLDEVQFSLTRFGLAAMDARAILTRLGLAALAAHSPHTLSYGQQHLLALASVMAYQPRLLLLDDPFAGLDAISCSYVWREIAWLRAQGSAVLIAMHRLPEHGGADQWWHIQQGQLGVRASNASA
nr:ABC transporter ATP-binding protein [Shewanella sp. NIFS-20-20]